MASKSITLLLVLYFVSASARSGSSTAIMRGLRTVPTDAKPSDTCCNVALDPKDPNVVQLGKFVIDEENKDAKSKLNFGRVLKAALLGRSGEVLRYALVIGASDSTGSDEYYAYVLVDQDSKEVVAFKKKKVIDVKENESVVYDIISVV